MRNIVLDIETNDLYYDATTIHCISIKIEDAPTVVYTSRPIKGSCGSIDDCLEELQKGGRLIMHNGINFDIPTIYKLTGVDLYKTCEVVDTLLISQLKYPNLIMLDTNRKSIPPKYKGKHGLMAWGYRLGKYKGDYGSQDNAWDKLTVEMVEYCRTDTEVTHALYHRFLRQGLPPPEAIRIEQEFAKIIARQEHYGWKFDIPKAEAMHIELLEDIEEAEEELFKVFKPINTWFPKGYPKVAIKKNGEKSVVLLRQEAEGYHYNDDFEWGKFEDVTFNPGSSQHVVKWIEHYFGKQKWIRNEPTDNNPLGSPKTGAEHLERMFGDYKWSYYLLKYLILTKLLGQLATGDKSWMNHIKSDGRIHGSVDTLGAVTRRCTHRSPNLAQVPSVKKDTKLSPELGGRCRDLFIVGEGKKLIGCDADALELRTLSHFMARYDGGEYGRIVDEGKKEDGTDVHTVNTKSAGLSTRDDGKTFIYAFLYGAGDEKIGKISGGGKKEGKRLKTKFLTKIPAIKQLSEGVQEAVKKRGSINAIDGNPYYIRSSHSALNVLLQGAGAMVMKYWLVEADARLSEKYENSWTAQLSGAKVQYEFVGNIHDEAQAEVDEDISKEVAGILEEAFLTITPQLGFRIPLRGTADIGDSWYDTH